MVTTGLSQPRPPTLLLWILIAYVVALCTAGIAPTSAQAHPKLDRQPSPLIHQTAAARSYRVGTLVIESPWARATPGGAAVGGGYLKITNTGAQSDRLIGGSLPVAADVEVHEMSMDAGVMKMRKLAHGLEIKPGQTVELKPGGYHLMFTGLREGLTEGQIIKGTLIFEKAGPVEVEYHVAPIGSNTPGGGHAQH